MEGDIQEASPHYLSKITTWDHTGRSNGLVPCRYHRCAELAVYFAYWWTNLPESPLLSHRSFNLLNTPACLPHNFKCDTHYRNVARCFIRAQTSASISSAATDECSVG